MISIQKDKQTISVYGQNTFGKLMYGANNVTGYCTESIFEEIITIYSSIKYLEDEEILRDPSNNLRAIFQRLDYLIALDIDDKYAEKMFRNFEFDVVFDAIARFRSLFTVKLELEHAHSILESNDPKEMLNNFSYISNYLQLALTEYQGAGLKPGSSVVFLGSGPLPLTLIVLCYQHGLRGIGIEQEPERAQLSREVLEKLGFSDQITIIDGNQSILPLMNTSELIMIAAQAEPKKEIFNHLAKVLPAGTKLSYRIYEKGLRRLLDTFSLYTIPAPFEEYLRVRPEPPVNNTVVFLMKH
jgi:hypothetical protein